MANAVWDQHKVNRSPTTLNSLTKRDGNRVEVDSREGGVQLAYLLKAAPLATWRARAAGVRNVTGVWYPNTVVVGVTNGGGNPSMIGRASPAKLLETFDWILSDLWLLDASPPLRPGKLRFFPTTATGLTCSRFVPPSPVLARTETSAAFSRRWAPPSCFAPSCFAPCRFASCRFAPATSAAFASSGFAPPCRFAPTATSKAGLRTSPGSSAFKQSGSLSKTTATPPSAFSRTTSPPPPPWPRLTAAYIMLGTQKKIDLFSTIRRLHHLPSLRSTPKESHS
jgi:hypothetical protein